MSDHMDWKNPWLIGGGILAVLLLGAKKASAAVIIPPFSGIPDERDLDALADMLITETSFNKSREEMAQIVWIAYNRARRKGKPIWFMVQPGSAPSPVWNTGSLYRKRFENARSSSSWNAARNFSESVLAGAYTNLGYTSFVHPAGMPTPPCASSRSMTFTPYGLRCLPDWIVGGRAVGSAWFA